MTLKRKIDKATFDGLNDVLKAEYKPNGDGYVLDADDATELQRALAAEKETNKTTATKLANVTSELDTLKKANGDWTTLEQSYKDQLAKKDKEIAEVNTTLTNHRRETHLGAAAAEIAKNFTVPNLVKGEIMKRLDLDPKDGTTVRVLDANGKPSALTVADLTKEFVDNKEFAAIVVANRASGSATKPNASGVQIPYVAPSHDGKPKLLAEMTPTEIAAHMAAKKAEAAGQA